MGKKKSAVFLVLITLVIAFLCAVCTVSFEYGANNIKKYNSAVSIMDKDSQLGGGYNAVYYPDGVISAEEYVGLDEDEKADYIAYANGSIYLEKESVCEEGSEAIKESFKSDFSASVKAITKRYESAHIAGARVDVCDDYTVRVSMAQGMTATGTAVQLFGYMGEFKILYGSDENSAQTIVQASEENPITDYVKGATSRMANDTAYVIIDFTSAGQELVKNATASASSDSTSTMYFKVGDNNVISLTVSQEIDQSSLAISGSYTEETANIVAKLIDSVVNGEETSLNMTFSEARVYEDGMGDNALMFIYIAFGAMLLASAVFAFVRYRLLGFTHLYTILTYAILMVVCLSFIPELYLGVNTIAATVIGFAILNVSNFVSFEYARKEYALGKTITSSVKQGYKKCFFHIFDLHIALAIIAFLTYFIATLELKIFALALGLAVLFSGVCTLLVNRFYWAIMMALAKNKGKFCHFKREEVEDE
ncbi:MAG: hypothetical protein K2L87_06000 [Clostridiales bacterium]|nr:hypothetical protein [Clostridiales bacterium]